MSFASNCKSRGRLWLLAALALPGAVFGASGETGALPGLASVAGELRKGGLVIYLRHATTENSEVADASAGQAPCEAQRNLSVKGRTEAATIGKAIKDMKIPIGTVMASPFCRTRDTAQIAFGRYIVDNDLYFAIGADAAETKRLAESLRRLLSAAPAAGTNTVLVSHSANLFEATGIFPKPEGVAIVFRPLRDGRFEALAKVSADEWGKFATADKGRR